MRQAGERALRRLMLASNTNTFSKWALRLAIGSALLFTLSLFLPCLHVAGKRPLYGYEILLTGWQGVLDMIIAWYANPLLFVSLFLGIRGRTPWLAASLAVVGTGIAATTWFVSGINNSSHVERITAFGPGVYAWQASHLMAAVATLLQMKGSRAVAPVCRSTR